MRRAALVLVLLLPSLAAAQAPPSPTLERAIKLYDKEDFFSSTIEAKKVLDGQTGDSLENIERAKFFLAKSLYQIEFYVPSLAMFQGIIQDGRGYKSASWKWIAALRKHVPDAMLVSSVETMTDADLADPILVSVADDLRAIRAAKTPAASDLRAITRDALGCTHPEPVHMRDVVTKLRSYDDNMELTAAVRLALRANDVYARTLDLAMDKTPRIRDARRWVGELRTELELFDKADRAWQTTMVAAEVMQEATIQHSLAESDMGARLREMLDAMESSLTTLGSYSTPPERCTRTAAPTLAGGPSSPMVVDPKRPGCGCATGGSPDGALLVVLLGLVLRRKSRAASRTRSLRA